MKILTYFLGASALLFAYRYHKNTIKKIITEYDKKIKQSKAVDNGFAMEHVAPLMFQTFDARDLRHIGNPIDYIIFDGASLFNSKNAQSLKGLTLLDIKTGTSTLSTIQRRIRDLVIEGNFNFVVYNPTTNKASKWTCGGPKKGEDINV